MWSVYASLASGTYVLETWSGSVSEDRIKMRIKDLKQLYTLTDFSYEVASGYYIGTVEYRR